MMKFKKCLGCNNTVIDSNKKCPYCGSSSFVEIEEKNIISEKSKDSIVQTPGSLGLGIFLGLVLGMIGFLIACISNQSKENGKTILGVCIGVLIQCLLALLLFVPALCQ